MSFSAENGYVPVSLNEILNFVRLQVNEVFGTDYSEVSFVGSNWYRFAYVVAQRMQSNEVKTSEIFQKLQQYIALTNERIQRPSVSFPGLLDAFAANDYVASIKEIDDTDAGKMFICVDVDDGAPDYDDVKLEIGGLIKDFVAAGTVTEGSEEQPITLSNGQEFTFKFALPNRIPVLLRVTIAVSENNLLLVPDDETIRQEIFDRINELYRLGLNFEPQRYYNLGHAAYAASVLFEWSDDDGSNWHDEVYDANFDDLYTFNLEDIAIIFS